MQRNFDPMKKQVEAWKGTRLPDDTAKLVIYRAFVEGKLDAPKHLARRVHDAYFNPRCEEFAPRTVWSLSDGFTSAFNDLDPIPQFKTTRSSRRSLSWPKPPPIDRIHTFRLLRNVAREAGLSAASQALWARCGGWYSILLGPFNHLCNGHNDVYANSGLGSLIVPQFSRSPASRAHAPQFRRHTERRRLVG